MVLDSEEQRGMLLEAVTTVSWLGSVVEKVTAMKAALRDAEIKDPGEQQDEDEE